MFAAELGIEGFDLPYPRVRWRGLRQSNGRDAGCIGFEVVRKDSLRFALLAVFDQLKAMQLRRRGEVLRIDTSHFTKPSHFHG